MVWTSFLCFCIFPIAFAIDADYYFSSPLRSRLSNGACSRLQQLLCTFKCDALSKCTNNKCHCVSIFLNNLNTDATDNVEANKQAMTKIDFEESALSDSVVMHRPALRHHIAHFCPNLDDARVCIRKCMVTGKPAFCGKDHVCYCGHRYSSHDDDTKYNPKKAFAQFNDLYEKYFGTKSEIEKD